MNKKTFLVILLTIFTIMIFITATINIASAYYQRPEPSFGGCYISTGHGMLDDLDCDKVPDMIDNCQMIPNPDQADQTNNGLGDACDLVISNIKAEPNVAMQGRSLIIKISLDNYREYDMNNLLVKAESPGLKIGDQERVNIKSGEVKDVEVIMRIPDCATPSTYDMIISIEYPYTSGKKEVFTRAIKINVQRSGLCELEKNDDIIDISEIQDIHPIEGAHYPFTIKNSDNKNKAFSLSIKGIDWGSAEISPNSMIIVPPGGTREGDIHVWANDDVTGKKSFYLIISSGDDAKQIPLLADIPEPPVNPDSFSILNWGLLTLILIAIIIIAIILTYRKKNKKK